MLTQLPLKNGVSPSKAVLPLCHALQSAPKTVLDYLCQHYPHIDDGQWRQRFDDGRIFVAVDGGFITVGVDDDYTRHQGKTLYYYRFLANETPVPFCHHVLFENERILAVDKPHFLTMTPSGRYVQETLLTRLKDETGNGDLTPIHRLDRETAGVVLFCKDKRYRGDYQALFARHAVDKLYHAIALFDERIDFPLSLELCLERGNPFYTMQVADNKTANSQTWITLLQVDKNRQWAKYQLNPKTGKLHQLRVHLNHLGLPIKNDPYYPTLCHKDESDFSKPLQLLAKSVGFIDPIDGQDYCFVSQKALFLD